MGGRTAFAPAVGAWAGLLAGFAWNGPSFGVALTLAVPLAWLAWRGLPNTSALASTLALAILGAAHAAGYARSMEAARAHVPAGGGLYRLEVEVDGPGARGGESVEARVRAARPPLEAGTRLRLRLPDGRRAAWGDRLALLATVEHAPGRRNPGGFDARAWDFARGVAARARVHTVVRHDSTSVSWPRASIVRWRRAIEATLDQRLSETARAYAVPLVVGDRSGLSPAQRAGLRDAGLAHLLALSGLHVTWLAWLVRAALTVLGGSLAVRHAGGALGALFYLGIAGPLPALSRAACMETLSAAARLAQRAADPVQVWSLTVLALLAVRPGWALDLGFQLSCAASLGLVTLAARPARGNALFRAVRVSFAATAAAQLAAAPILIATFHGLSWSVWLSNLAAVPVAGALLACAWGGTLAEIAWPGAGALLFTACEGLAAALDGIARVAAALPFAFVPCGLPGAAIALLALGGGALVIARLLAPCAVTDLPRGGAAASFGVACIAAGALVSLLPAPKRPDAGRVWLVALDIGQGDAIALGTRSGWWLIDAGPRAPGYDAGESIVVPFLRWAGVMRLEGFVITHLDSDHAGGAVAVWRTLRPPAVWCPDSAARALAPPGARLASLARGDTLNTNPLMHALWPPAGAPIDHRNAASAVLALELGRSVALLTGDVEAGVEDSIAWPAHAAWLKVAHHGAGGSTSEAFLARVRPRVAVISSGARNPFGHPHPATLERLARAGTGVARTDQEGAVWYELDATGARRIDWRASGALRPRAVTAPARPRAEP